jgi:hypothetical protein
MECVPGRKCCWFCGAVTEVVVGLLGSLGSLSYCESYSVP